MSNRGWKKINDTQTVPENSLSFAVDPIDNSTFLSVFWGVWAASSLILGLLAAFSLSESIIWLVKIISSIRIVSIVAIFLLFYLDSKNQPSDKVFKPDKFAFFLSVFFAFGSFFRLFVRGAYVGGTASIGTALFVLFAALRTWHLTFFKKFYSLLSLSRWILFFGIADAVFSVLIIFFVEFLTYSFFAVSYIVSFYAFHLFDFAFAFVNLFFYAACKKVFKNENIDSVINRID